MGQPLQAACMADVPRAFLTPGELEAVDPDSDMDSDTRSAHLSRIKRKLPKMRRDAEELRKHRPEIAEDLEEAVCREELEERIEWLEEQVAQLTDDESDSS